MAFIQKYFWRTNVMFQDEGTDPGTPFVLRLSGAVAFVVFGTLSAGAAQSRQSVPPKADLVPHEVRTAFGAVRDDPYFWLRDDTRSDPRVLAYLKAENAYTDETLQPIAPLRATVLRELKSRIPSRDVSVPYFERGYWYYTRFESGREYPVLARKEKSLKGHEEVLLDEQERRALVGGYYSVGMWAVSPNGRLLAWTEDRVGRRQYDLHVKDLATGRVLKDSATGLSSNILWGGDSRTILYVVNDKELRPEWLKAHAVGSPASTDRALFDELDATFYSMLTASTDKKFLCLNGFSLTASEWRCAPLADPTAFQIVLPREVGHIYDVDHSDGEWYIRTNWRAPNFRVMMVPDSDLARGRDAWQELMSPGPNSLVEGLRAFDGYIAVEERLEANKRIVIRRADGRVDTVPSPEPAFAMSISPTQGPGSRWLRYQYDSLTTPTSIQEFNVDSGAQRTLKSLVVAGYDRARYVTEHVLVTARDGSEIPVSLVHQVAWKKDGKAALLQYGYGSYAYSIDPKFRNEAMSLVDRGGVFAIAHVRGGEEMGRAWYDQGHLLNKMNGFNDFVDVTRGLVGQGFAAQGRVAALGGSAGGTLMGGIANMAPGDYRVILAIVPYVDAITTMLDPSIPLVTREYDEWGNPNKKAEYEYMLGWSPYDNVGHHSYPAMYVFTGLWDSQVQYFEPTKWVAKLRAEKTGDDPLVLRINMQGGHGGSAGRFQQINEQAEYLAFALWELGYRE
jgi:oligopeptidase B